MLAVLLIKFNEYSGLDFLSCLPRIIPIFPVTCLFDVKGVMCS
jgi:hypothetical protein